MSLIGISGKINSGKDTIGKIIQYLTAKDVGVSFIKNMILTENDITGYLDTSWKVKKFADKLKDIVCLLIGCTREQLEDRDFKEKELGEEWWKYIFTDGRGIYGSYLDNVFTEIKENLRIEKLTPRKLMQLLGTTCGRNIIHPNIWINVLMSDYKDNIITNVGIRYNPQKPTRRFPNWIITDLRFPNELKAIKDRGGISIRVNRIEKGKTYFIDSRYDSTEENIEVIADYDVRGYDDLVFKDSKGLVYRQADYKINTNNQHESETALDNSKFDYNIINNGTIEELIENVKEILIKENII